MGSLHIPRSAAALCGAVLLLGVPARGGNRISSLLDGPNLHDYVQKTSAVFSRSSPAHLTDATPVAGDQPRFEPLALNSVLEEQWITTEAGPAARAILGDTFLGARTIYHDHPDQRVLFQSADAVNWQPLHVFDYDIASVFVTPQNAILVFTLSPSPGRIFRSDDGGQSFDLVYTLPSDTGYVRHWNYDVLGSVLYVGEYGSKFPPNNARHILRSEDDGQTWQIDYAPPEQYSYHVHKVLADPYANCIWQANGDQDSNAIKRSCQNGPWETVTPQLAPTAGVARPDGIYWGNDFHVDTWATVDRYHRLADTYESRLYVDRGGYVWDMIEHANVMYATLYNYQRTVTPTLWASQDGVEWAMLREYPLGHSGLEIFGPIRDNWMYGAYLDGQTAGYTQYRLRTPDVLTRRGLRIEPAAQNLLNSEQNSSAEQGTVGWTGVHWQGGSGVQIASDTAVAHHGGASIHVTSPPGSHRPGIRTPDAFGTFPAGTTLVGSLWVKGPVATLRANLVDRTNSIEGPRLRVHLTDAWHRVVVRQTLQLPANTMAMVIYENLDAADADFHVDSAAIYADTRPLTWNLGGTPRAAESLHHDIGYPASWTETWHWKADHSSDDTLDPPLVIKSWTNPAGRSMFLVYESIYRRFVLQFQESLEEPAETFLATPFLRFRKDAIFKMAVTCSPQVVELYVFAPIGRIYKVGPSPDTPFEQTWIGSDPRAENQSGGLFAHHNTFDGVLAEPEIIAALNQALVAPDLDADGDVDGTDFLTFAPCYNGANNPMPRACSTPLADFDNDADVDSNDFLTFSNCFNAALNPPNCP